MSHTTANPYFEDNGEGRCWHCGDPERAHPNSDARMGRSRRNPLPEIRYGDVTYKIRSRKIAVPDLEALPRMAALVWLNQNTIPRGRSRKVEVSLPPIELLFR